MPLKYNFKQNQGYGLEQLELVANNNALAEAYGMPFVTKI